jgi:hypothetical protein
MNGWVKCTGVVDAKVSLGDVVVSTLSPPPDPPPPPPFPTILVACLLTVFPVSMLFCVFFVALCGAAYRRLLALHAEAKAEAKAAEKSYKSAAQVESEEAIEAIAAAAEADAEADRKTAAAVNDALRGQWDMRFRRAMRLSLVFVADNYATLVDATAARFPRTVEGFARLLFIRPQIMKPAAPPNMEMYATVIDGQIVNSVAEDIHTTRDIILRLPVDIAVLTPQNNAQFADAAATDITPKVGSALSTFTPNHERPGWVDADVISYSPKRVTGSTPKSLVPPLLVTRTDVLAEGAKSLRALETPVMMPTPRRTAALRYAVPGSGSAHHAPTSAFR